MARASSIRMAPTASRSGRFPGCCSSGATPWPAHVEVRQQRPPREIPDGWVHVTFIGHATFLIQTAAGNVLIDPVFVDRAGPRALVGPKRVRRPGVAFDDLPPIALVLLSHNHYDHCDLATLAALARRWNPRVVTLLRNGPLLRSVGSCGRGTGLVAAVSGGATAAVGNARAALFGARARSIAIVRCGAGSCCTSASAASSSPAIAATVRISASCGTSGSTRPRASADWGLRAAVVHEGRACHARPKRSGRTSISARARASACISGRFS